MTFEEVLLQISVRRAALAALASLAVVAAPAAAAPNNNNSSKLTRAVTLEGVRTHQAVWQQIADAAGGNRFAGLEGYDMSAQYVVDTLEAAGYSPELHEFEYEASYEVSPSRLSQVSPAPAAYVNGVDFDLMDFSGGGSPEGELVPVSSLACTPEEITEDVTGRIALISRGACTFRAKAESASAKGAIGVLVYNNVDGLLLGTLGEGPAPSAPVFGLTRELGLALVAAAGEGPVVMSMFAEVARETLTTHNVLADLEGRNDDNVIVVGAHLDSVDTGPGINDNGSGSGAILETAVQMAKVKPWNTVRFAWWSAEESGLIGSNRYVQKLVEEGEIDDIALNLNFDMVGSPNYGMFVYDGDNSAFPVGTGSAEGPPGSDVIESVFYGFFEQIGMPAEPTPFSGRSDYGPFIAQGIPAGGLFTGAEQPKTPEQVIKWGGTAGIAYDFCYHASCDTFETSAAGNEALDANSDAIAHTTITFAQSTELINEVRGKGNFKRPRQGAGDGAGTGSSGVHEHWRDAG